MIVQPLQPRLNRVLWPIVLVVAAGSALGVRAAGTVQGRPGLLVLAGAADSTAAYRWQVGPAAGQRSLVWEQGLLTLPDSLVLDTFGPRDLAVPTGATLTGTSGGGDLLFADGSYALSAPLLLTDGCISFYAAAGELEIVGERLRYLPPQAVVKGDGADPRAGMIMLAGMVLLVVVLLRLARKQAGRRRP